MTTLRFTSYVQPATGAALGAVDPADADPNAPDPPAAGQSLRPSLHVEDTVGGNAPFDAAGPEVAVLGPGAIVGLQAGEVIGRFPVPGAVGTEAINLAAVELASTDLPWRFSPARAGDAQRLRPWLVLVVVTADVEVQPGVPAPRLSVDVAQLPDLAESWAWAHAQLDGDGSDPRRGRSRLLCPRKLPPNRALRAAVVPAFEGGRLAGLGFPVDPARANLPAWDVAGGGTVTLPVYDHWTFTTGADADFEALARRIQPVHPSELGSFGYRAVDVSEPWIGDDRLPGDAAVTMMGGALRPLAPPPATALTAAQSGDFHGRIAEQLAAGADGDLAPPLRGGRHRVRTTILPDGGDWLDEANREPVRRLAAGRGADWVIAHQEELMSKAWERAGEIRAAARRLALGRASVAVTESLQRRHLDRLSGDELIAVTAPAAARARLDGRASQPSLQAVFDTSAAPSGATSTTLARLKRPAARVGRAIGASQPVTRAVAGLLAPRTMSATRAADLTATVAVAANDASAAGRLMDRGAGVHLETVAGAATSVWVAAQVAAHQGVAQPMAVLTAVADPSVFAAGPAAAVPTLAVGNLRAEVLAAVGRDRLGPAVLPGGAVGSAPAVAVTSEGVRIDAASSTALVRSASRAVDAVQRRLMATMTIPGRAPVASPAALAPVLMTPDVPSPMAMALIDRDPEWFLPGIGTFPLDRATLLSPDDLFAESVMLGANDELLTEFLWREFPTDGRGTPIRRFWPRPDSAVDIGPIHEWTGALGDHMMIDGAATTVILIRAELFRRYPTTVVLAAPAQADPARAGKLIPVPEADRWLVPLFTVPVDPATRAVAFAVRPEEVTVSPAVAPGWFFVLVEPPTSMRFGFDVPDEPAPALEHWYDLTWDSVFDAARAMASARRAVPQPTLEPPGAPVWGADAADVAGIALQRPVRVALHASRMVG